MPFLPWPGKSIAATRILPQSASCTLLIICAEHMNPCSSSTPRPVFPLVVTSTVAPRISSCIPSPLFLVLVVPIISDFNIVLHFSPKEKGATSIDRAAAPELYAVFTV
ncbi:MAG: hypothetical protein ACLR07_04880 [Christensenellales bacterium]